MNRPQSFSVLYKKMFQNISPPLAGQAHASSGAGKNISKHFIIVVLVLFACATVALSVLYSLNRELASALVDARAEINDVAHDVSRLEASHAEVSRTQEELIIALSELEEGTGKTQETLSDLRSDIVLRRTEAESQEITSVVRAWGDRVARVRCSLRNEDGDTSEAVSSGVGLYIGGVLHVMTNKHVIEEGGEELLGCEVEFPQHAIDGIEISPQAITVSPDRDVAYLRVNDSSVRIAADTTQQACQNPPETGDHVITLGFPRVGAKESITVTDGIISGIEDDFYITSAKIERGNSGGAAILTKSNCFVGLPTLVVVGRIESLARILPISSLSSVDL